MGGLITCIFHNRDFKVENWRQYGLVTTSWKLLQWNVNIPPWFTHMRAMHTDTHSDGMSQSLCCQNQGSVRCSVEPSKSKAERMPSWETPWKLRVGGVEPGDEHRVPQKQETSSKAWCLGFTELCAWRKTCILVACAFLHLSSLKQSLLPRGRDKTSQEGTPTIPRVPVNRFLPWGIKVQALRGVRIPHLLVELFLILCLYSGKYLDQSLQVANIHLDFSFLV